MFGRRQFLVHSRDWLDYEERVCTYWPEFARHGKGRTTVRHSWRIRPDCMPSMCRSIAAWSPTLNALAAVLARQKPVWEPGTRQAYQAITLGFYESKLLRRVDPQHRSLGQFFQDEIAGPLGLDVYIRLPESIPNSRLAKIEQPSLIATLTGFPIALALASLNRRSLIRRALAGSELPNDDRRIYSRNFEVPSGGGVGTARAITRAYSVFANDGRELGAAPRDPRCTWRL